MKARVFSGRCLLILAAVLLVVPGGARGGSEPGDQFFQRLQSLWDDVKLSRDLEYWRAPELTPGSFLCLKPAAADVWVKCDRWPDGSDVRRFGLDAVRLSGARTEHEKALAVYRWVRRWMIYNNRKGCPVEWFPPRLRKNPMVSQADKLLNVYGVHWCGGQARVVEQVWRALGYRAEKVIRGGHTIVGMYYRDYDGVERWHGLDVSHGRVAWDKSYRRLLSLDELSSRWYSFFYQYGLPGNGHIYFNDHRMELAFRLGERLERRWGNLGKPYQDNAARGRGMAERVPRYERGPYFPFTYGNGLWTYTPDLSRPDWQDGLAVPAVGMKNGRLQPVVSGKTATAVWHFRTPYIVADAAVKLKFFRRQAADVIRLYLSTDGGETWKRFWECPRELVGERELEIPFCRRFAVAEKGPPPPRDFFSPFGRYSYRLKLELAARGKPEDCRVEAVSFMTTVQLNIYSLPQLQPGVNRITVRGRLAPGTALRVTYLWDDPAGKNRRNVTVVERTPYTYEITAGGKKWEDCVCRAITVEAVRADGRGNRTVVKEKPAPFAKLAPLPPVAETMGRWNGQPLAKDLPEPAKVLAAVGNRDRFKRLLRGAVMLDEPRTFPAFRDLAYAEKAPNNKLLAFDGLYRADPRHARPVLLAILGDRCGERVAWSPGKDREDKGWGREYSWCAGGTVIGYIAAEAGWREFLPGMLQVLASKMCKPGWGPRYGTIRVIGRLGKGDPAASEAIRGVLEHKFRHEHGDALIAAAAAAGRIGDPALIPSLRRYLNSGYWPLKQTAALSLGILGDRDVIPRMQAWLQVPFDENFRGCAAAALGCLGDQDSAAALQAALDVEPFPWVRRQMSAALGKIARRPGKTGGRR